MSMVDLPLRKPRLASGYTRFCCLFRMTRVVFTVVAVTFVLVQSYDDGIPHVLRHCVLLPALAEKFTEFGEQHRLGTLDDFWGNAVTSHGFSVCQPVYGVTELFL